MRGTPHTVIFACVHNAGRSQMAAAFFNASADATSCEAHRAWSFKDPAASFRESARRGADHRSSNARAVTLVVRAGSLGERMSQYLVERCEQHPRISIRTKSRVTRAIGEGRLEKLVIHNDASETDAEMPADALFILIGGEPTSQRVADWLRLDENGFYLTGNDLLADRRPGPRWPLERQPFPLESSQPGVFVIGDARHGSIKRIASAVGEGALAVQFVQRYLAESARGAATGPGVTAQVSLSSA